jgi:hypothetical protein
MAIDTIEKLRRLSFIKYLYQMGAEQSGQPEPLCNSSILSLHDAIELYLQLACEDKNVSTDKKADFFDYFGALKSVANISHQESMKRFNKTRVGIKHNGTMVSKSDVEYFKNICHSFFIDNTKILFNMDFDNISMVNLVTYDIPKQHLLNAETEMNKLNYKQAFCEVTLAFWKLIEEYEQTKNKAYGQSPFFFGGISLFNHFTRFDDKELDSIISDVKNSLEKMQSALKIISLGFDYRKFTKFNLLTPGYVRTVGGYVLNERWNSQYNLDDAKWCYDYVIECCIILQNFDYKVDIRDKEAVTTVSKHGVLNKDKNRINDDINTDDLKIMFNEISAFQKT